MSLPELPPRDIHVDAFGEVIPRDGRGFVFGDFYTADQMRSFAVAARADLAAQLVEAQKNASQEHLTEATATTLANAKRYEWLRARKAIPWIHGMPVDLFIDSGPDAAIDAGIEAEARQSNDPKESKELK